MGGLYSINNSRRLFERLVVLYSTFYSNPSEEGIFDVIFPLCHLREWICPGKYESYKNKDKKDITKEEALHALLHEMPEYKTIRELCNAAKHYNANTLDNRTQIYQGARVGLANCEDSLDVTHYVVDGRDIRDIFWPVYSVYFSYFNQTE